MMRQKESVEKKISSGFSNFLHLFDEQWFFSNALNGGLAEKRMASSSAEQLIRTPLVPPPDKRSGGQEEEAGPRNYCSASGRNLRCSASLSFPISSCTTSSKAYSEQSRRKQKPPRTEHPHRRCPNPNLLMCCEASNRKAFQKKKWRSVGDLETMELQGFKDLGFVFDETEGSLSSTLLSDLSALQGRRNEEGKEEGVDGELKRYYLPESWFTQRSHPPMVVWRVGCCLSGEEMKAQLRFWARAVASDVRVCLVRR